MIEDSFSGHSQRGYLRYSFSVGKATALTEDVLLGEGHTMGRELTKATSVSSRWFCPLARANCATAS